MRAVAANREQDVDAALLEEIDNDVGADRPTRGAQQRSAELMNMVNHFGIEPDRRTGRFGREPRVAIPNAQYGGDAVVIMQLQVERANHIVQAGAESAAGHDGSLGVGRIEVQLFARPGFFEQVGTIFRLRPHLHRMAEVDLFVYEGAFGRASRLKPLRRWDGGGTEIGNCDLFIHEDLNSPGTHIVTGVYFLDSGRTSYDK